MNTHQNNLHQRRNCTLTTETEFNEKSINTNRDKDQSCIEEILKPIEAHLNDMTQKHNKTMTVRFDMKAPQEAEDLNNKTVGRIIENMRRAINRNEYAGRHDPDPRFLCVAKDQGNGAHYHCLAIVNGNAIQNPHTIHKTAEKYLGKALGITEEEETKGLVHYCNTNGEKEGNKENIYNQAFSRNIQLLRSYFQHLSRIQQNKNFLLDFI